MPKDNISETPRTDWLLDCQNQDLFYSGTESNVQEMVSNYKKQTEEHARTLEKQVTVLVKFAATHASCFGCPAKDAHKVCQHSDSGCFEAFAAWSLAQANRN